MYLSFNIPKLLNLLLLTLPFLLSTYAHTPPLQPCMIRHRRSVASWLTRVSSKASDWIFGSVPVPHADESQVPKAAVGGVDVMPKMPYPYVTGMLPRLASETLESGGLVGAWMCLHVTPGVEGGDGAADGEAGHGNGDGGAGNGDGAGVGIAGAGDAHAGGAGGSGPGLGGAGSGTGARTATGAGADGFGDAGSAVDGPRSGFGGSRHLAGAGTGGGAGGFNGGTSAESQGSGFNGQQQPLSNGGVGGSFGGAGMGSSYPEGAAGGQSGAGTGVSSGDGGDQQAGDLIRYKGQLLTIDQYQQALQSGNVGDAPLSRRALLPGNTSSLFMNTFLHKRDSPKILMCINGDPSVPPIKFDTMTGMRLRDPTTRQDGVVEITNLPNYKMPYMPFLPTAEMWAEQQSLMLEQEKVIEANMTTAPPPKK